MFIRKTKTKTLDDGEAYFTYRLVESVREGQQVKQRTLLNLGKDFAIEPEHWPLLTARMEQLLQDAQAQQAELFALTDEIGVMLETAAQRYSRLLVHKMAQPVDSTAPATDYHRVDIHRVDAIEARSIGAETLALHAVEQLQLTQKLTALGFNGVDRAAALGSIIGRMVSPGSELHTHEWLQSCTALGELLDHDFGSTSLSRLYRVSDQLLKHQAALESFLADQEQSLLDLNRRIVLYDLTNTYFEGQCASNPKAQFGRSKEKRSDCPLVTLGLVLDGDGFPLGSQVFPGNASEPATLKTMLEGLQGQNPLALSKPVIILDAGIASAEKDRHCGVYCLRSNMPDWSEEQLWTTYVMLTEIEATFRSLKTELGLRPVYHQKEERVTGHLFISLLAYHLVHTLRHQLKRHDIHLSWDSIRMLMSTQQRMTLILPTDAQSIIYLRTTTRAEIQQQQIYDALGIKPDPLGKRKTIIDHKKSVVPTDSG